MSETKRVRPRFVAVDATSEAAQAAMTAYFAELNERFVSGFDATDAFAHDADAFAPPNGVFLLALDDDDLTLGCGGLQRLDSERTEVKRMWVAPSARGRGVARALLTELEARAVAAGFTTIVLDTNGVLSEARAFYASSGYTEIDPYNDNPYAEHWFTKSLV